AFLRQISPALVIQYLTHVFEAWSDQTPVLHDDMIAAHLDALSGMSDVGAASSATEPADEEHAVAVDAVGELRKRLQRFLRSSQFYSPERALARLPEDRLFEERALVLSRLGRHEHALGLLVFSVASLALAEQYCIDNVGGCPDVFVTLLRTLMSAPPRDVFDKEAQAIRSGAIGVSASDKHSTADDIEDARQRMHWQFAGHLLSVHYLHIPAADALRILPRGMEFTPDIVEYLRNQLCALDQDMRSTNLAQNLRVGADQQARRQVRRMQSSYVVVTETRTCPHCLKRIGSGTAFAVIPPRSGKEKEEGHAVVHYSCWQRQKSASKKSSAPEASASVSDEVPLLTISLTMQTATLATFALAVAGAAYAAGADSNHAVKGKAMNGGSAAAAAPAPEARTVTVTTTVNGAGANQASFAAAALAGALAFASYM
ncbi:Vam6/Vps39-like protein, partial [Coemansia sp. RSA 2598]